MGIFLPSLRVSVFPVIGFLEIFESLGMVHKAIHLRINSHVVISSNDNTVNYHRNLQERWAKFETLSWTIVQESVLIITGSATDTSVTARIIFELFVRSSSILFPDDDDDRSDPRSWESTGCCCPHRTRKKQQRHMICPYRR